MCMGGPKAPPPAAVLPEAPQTPTESARGGTGDTDRRRRAAMGGNTSGTVLTSSRGVQDGATTATKTLLGA